MTRGSCFGVLLVAIGLLLTISGSSCARRELAEAAPDPPCPAAADDGAALTAAFLRDHREAYRRAISRARAWLDALTVDPIALRAAGRKGKKHFVEHLDAYVGMYRLAPAAERPELRRRIEAIAAVTRDPRYHDMASLSDLAFKQDATSYLRAAYLLDEVGIDTASYRAHIRAIQPRLDAHMVTRGVHQRLAFHRYYKHFGLKEPFPLANAAAAGIIASRRSPYAFEGPLRVYHLTHEIFVPFGFGADLDARPFDADDLAYLRHVLERLTVLYIMRRDADLVAELVSCLRYLRMTDVAPYREALAYLLTAQDAQGRWGRYDQLRKRHGAIVDVTQHLHTVGVTIDALMLAFERP